MSGPDTAVPFPSGVLGVSAGEYAFLFGPTGDRRPMTKDERRDPSLIPNGWRSFRPSPLTSQGFRVNTTVPKEGNYMILWQGGWSFNKKFDPKEFKL